MTDVIELLVAVIVVPLSIPSRKSDAVFTVIGIIWLPLIPVSVISGGKVGPLEWTVSTVFAKSFR